MKKKNARVTKLNFVNQNTQFKQNQCLRSQINTAKTMMTSFSHVNVFNTVNILTYLPLARGSNEDMFWIISFLILGYINHAFQKISSLYRGIAE